MKKPIDTSTLGPIRIPCSEFGRQYGSVRDCIAALREAAAFADENGINVSIRPTAVQEIADMLEAGVRQSVPEKWQPRS